MKIYLIRHGKTQGNLERRYIGATDEPLCKEGLSLLKKNKYPNADIVFSSPMQRCLMTAAAIYPTHTPVICGGLREMNFGDFEGKCYDELKDNAEYVKWLESGGYSPFPNGEGREEFAARCQSAFETCLSQIKDFSASQHISSPKAAFIIHGGAIMSIMQKYGTPKGEYYKWQIENGAWIELDI